MRGESIGAAKVDLNGHEAGNGGYSQGTPKARRAFLYSEIAHRRMVAGRGIPRNLGRNNNSPATRCLATTSRRLSQGLAFRVDSAIEPSGLRFSRHENEVAIPDSQSFKDLETFLFVYVDITRVCRLKK